MQWFQLNTTSMNARSYKYKYYSKAAAYRVQSIGHEVQQFSPELLNPVLYQVYTCAPICFEFHCCIILLPL